MEAEIKKHLAGKLEVENSPSGMHVIGWLREGVDDKQISMQAALFGVKTSTVSAYLLAEPARGGLILGYTAINEKQIKKALSYLLKQWQVCLGKNKKESGS